MLHDIKCPFTHKTLFSIDELKCKGSFQGKLSPGFADHLLALRSDFDESMVVSSCCRSRKHNDKIGGHSRSLHVFDYPVHDTDGCCAIDIITKNTAYTARLVDLALKHGWSIGVAKGFIHLDRRSDFTNLTQGVFGYG